MYEAENLWKSQFAISLRKVDIQLRIQYRISALWVVAATLEHVTALVRQLHFQPSCCVTTAFIARCLYCEVVIDHGFMFRGSGEYEKS
jgi:hypothetical protein